MTWTSRPSTPTTIHLDDDLQARLILTHLGLSGNPSVGRLIQQLGGAAGVLERATTDTPDTGVDLPDGTLRRIAHTARPSIAQEIADTTERQGLRLLTPERPGWPSQVDDLGPAAPLALWADVPEALLTDGIAAVVGPRHPDREERHATLEIATALADQGWVVAAFDALGVGSLTLRAAAAMQGRGIQVLATGIHGPVTSRLQVGLGRLSAAAPGDSASARGTHLQRATLTALASRVFTISSERCLDTAATRAIARSLQRPHGDVAATT